MKHLGELEYQDDLLLTMPFPDEFRTEGWIYVLSNEYMPEIYKIGMTTTHPSIRAKELSSGTGVPAPFKIEAAFYSDDPRGDEQNIHNALSEYRINDSREFFKYDLAGILETCEEFCLSPVEAKIEEVANSYDVICLETLNNLDIDDLYDDIGIRVFGNALAAAERLIRIGAKQVALEAKKGNSFVFHEKNIFKIVSEIDQSRDAYLLEVSEQQAKSGIYGPRIPGGF